MVSARFSGVALVLAEQTLLIAFDPEKGRDTADWGSDAGLAAALLLDLARLELLEVDADGKLVALDGVSPGHDLVRDAYATIRSSAKRRNAKGWVDRLPRELKPLRQRLARGLVQLGILSEEHSKRLGVVPTTRFPTIDATPERELRERLQGVLVTGREPTEEEALLIGLLEPLGLIDSVVTKDQRRVARKRAKVVAEHGLAGSAVRDSVRAVQAAVIAAAIVPTVTTSN